ncbi:MAG TPA: hypothetical protein VGA56_22775 [Opitutaceae bacterium]
MDFTGRPMRGFVFVRHEGLEGEGDLAHWIERALAFNPRAKVSAKRKASARTFRKA